MKKLKTHSIKVRMTEEEMAFHLKQAASYTSMSHYVRSALKEYSHPDLKLQHELIPQNRRVLSKGTQRAVLGWRQSESSDETGQ